MGSLQSIKALLMSVRSSHIPSHHNHIKRPYRLLHRVYFPQVTTNEVGMLVVLTSNDARTIGPIKTVVVAIRFKQTTPSYAITARRVVARDVSEEWLPIYGRR